MARKKDNKEAMFEALSRGTGSSMRLPDWAKPSSPQPFEHPEMLEKPVKQKEESKPEPQAVPEITIKLKAAASGFARKFQSLKDNINEKRKVAAAKKLAALEEALLKEEEKAREFLAERLEAQAAEEAAAAEEATLAEAAEEQAAEELQPQADDEVAAEQSTEAEEVEVEIVEEVEVIEAEIVEDDEVQTKPQKSVEETEEYDEVFEDVTAEVFEEDEDDDQGDEEIEEETSEEEETPATDDEEKDSGLFASLQSDEEEQPEIEEETAEEDEEEDESEAVEEVEEAPVVQQPQETVTPKMTGEEAGKEVNDIKIKSVPSESDIEKSDGPQPAAGEKKPRSVEVKSHVTATSIQQQVDLAEDNALISQTIYARQVAMETSPEDSVHITLSKKAFLGILCGAVGIICLVFLIGNLFSKKPAAVPTSQPSQQQEQQAAEQPKDELLAATEATPQQPQIQTPPAVVTPAPETPNADDAEVTVEPGKRDPKRFYIVIQQLMSASTKDREEAFNIAEFCKEHGLPAEVVMIDGKKLAVWSLVGLKVTDDDNARKHAMMVEQLGKDYFKTSRTYDFRQRMRDGRLRPYYIIGKPYATQTDGNKND